MNTLAKIGLSLIGVLVLYKGAQATSAYIVSQGMAVDIDPKTKVHPDGLEIITHIKIANPTDKSLSLTSPFVELLHKGEVLSHTDAKIAGHKIRIEPHSNTDLPIRLKLSWGDLTGILESIHIRFPEHYTNLQKSLWLYQNYSKILNTLGLKVKYSTYANGFPYSDTENISL